MKNQFDHLTTCFQLQQARELMAQGQHERALVLALNALQHAMNHLRDTLLTLQNNLTQAQMNLQKAAATKDKAGGSPPDAWEKKARVYH